MKAKLFLAGSAIALGLASLATPSLAQEVCDVAGVPSGTATEGGALACGAGSNASGGFGTAIGGTSLASGLYSTAIGNFARATGQDATAVGVAAYATDFATAIGFAAQGTGLGATALGIFAQSTGDFLDGPRILFQRFRCQFDGSWIRFGGDGRKFYSGGLTFLSHRN